jgi:hypothetical protein
MSTQNTKCSKQKSVKAARQDLAQVMKAMGMDQTCKQMAETAFAAGSTAGSVSGGWGAAEANVSAQFQAAAGKTTNEGCKQTLLNLSNSLSNFQSISCSLQESSETVDISAFGQLTISIQNESPETDEATKQMLNDIIARQQATYDKAVENATKYAMNGGTNDSSINTLNKIVENARSALDKTQKTLRGGDITIRGSTIKNTSGSTISTTVSMSGEQKNAVKRDLTNQIKQAAEQKLKTELGVNSLSPNATGAITQQMTDNKDLIDNTIQATTRGVSVKNDGGGNITIINKTGGDIILDDVDLNNEFLPKIIANSIFSTGQAAASDIAARVLADQSSKQIADGKSAGLNDLARELGKANTDAIDTTMTKSKGIFGVIIAVFALMVFGSFAKKGGSPEAKQKTQYAMSFLLIVVGASLFGGGTYLKKSGDKGDKGVLATLKGVGTGLITYSGAALIVFGLIGIFWAKMTGPTSDEAASRSSGEAASRSSGEPSASITMVD